MSQTQAGNFDKNYNWAGNYSYKAARLHAPETVEQIQELVSRCSKIKALGSRHSFNDIADTPEDLISLEHFNSIKPVNREDQTVTIGGGVRYGELCKALQSEGFALHNLASLPHISVAGACATGTHGSGTRNGNLATAVRRLKVVTGSGEVIVLSRDQEGNEFAGAVVSLGGLGAIVELTLDVEPSFEVSQHVYENLPFAQFEEHFMDMAASAYSVSFFTDWGGSVIDQVWLKHRLPVDTSTEGQPDLFGATPAKEDLHPIKGNSAIHCTRQMGLPGPWYDRLPHFRHGFTPSVGEELQSEYFLPRYQAVEAFQALIGLQDRIAPLLQVSEIRTIAADNLWMSMSYEQDSVAFHFTWKKDWPNVRQLLPLIEDRLAPIGPRPHWGKLFTMPGNTVRPLYKKLPEFQQLLESYDPQGKFRNSFLDRIIFGAD